MSHPEDCEDCGKLHISWSRHDRERRKREAEVEEHGDAAEMRFTRLYGLSPGGVPLYVEVPEEDYLPSTDADDEYPVLRPPCPPLSAFLRTLCGQPPTPLTTEATSSGP